MTHWIITSSLLILAVLVIRFVGRDRLSGRVRYALWGLVLLRLLMPFSIGESALSVRNWLTAESVQTQTSETYEPSETIQTGGTIQIPQTQQTPVQSGEETYYVNFPLLVWAVGAVIVGGVFLVSNLRFWLRLRRSRQYVLTEGVPVYESAAVETPCLFGFPRPSVYVTPEVVGDNLALRHVLAHELTHYRHKDHIWSLLRCLCVTLHWYNPLVWLAAYLSQQDAELACDEGALERLNDGERLDYARTLLDLTCVGYRGMLTTATSMTGSEGDLKARIKRIVKNREMTIAAVVLVTTAVLLIGVSVFTGAMSPGIEGLWRLEISVLGVGYDEPASAYMEYEFYDTRGVRTMIVGDEIRSAEWFSYSENPVNGLLEIGIKETVNVETYAWELTEDTLTLVQDRRELVLTRVEQREEKPYLTKGPFSVNDLRCSRPDEDYYANLSVLEQTELMYLLRSGTVTGTRDEVSSNLQYQYKFNINNHGADKNLHISNGLIYGDDKNRGYEVSNIDEIVAWLEAREWRDDRAYSIYGISVEPEPVEGAVNIAWSMGGTPARSNYMVPTNQTAWRDAVDLAKAVGVPDGSDLTIIECMDFGLYADGQHWYFDTDGTCYIAGAELYIAPEYTATLMKMLQPYVDVISPDVGDTLPYAGTTHFVVWDSLAGSTLRFVNGDTMEKLGIAIRESMGEPKSGEGIEYDEGYYKLFSDRLGIEGREILISDRGELVIDWEQHYDLFEPEELLYLLGELFTEENSMITEGFAPGDIDGIASAVMVLREQRYPADAARLAFLEELLSEAELLGYPTSCAFGGRMELTMADGRVLCIEPALDSCAVFKIGEEYYEYGNKFETDDSGSYGNEELLGIFGIDYKVIEELFTVVDENEGGVDEDENAGDVVRVRSGQSYLDAATMTDETRETLMALLAEGIYEPVEENAEVTCTAYSYMLLCAADYGFPEQLTVSDNGSVYADGLRYEPENYDEIWALLDGVYGSLSPIDAESLE